MNKIIFDKTAERVLDENQKSINNFLEEFSKTHFLVGGTAIALSLGHRKSIDFDFFILGKQGSGKEIFRRIEKTGLKIGEGSDLRYLSDEEESEANIFINGVKIQLLDFSRNPFGTKINLESENILLNCIKSPNLLDLGAMKIFAMMYRKKWKDAVDLFFIIKNGYSFEEILEKTKIIFTNLFQEEAVFENIIEGNWDKSEKVEYLIENPPKDEEIEKFLINEIKKFFVK